MPRVLHPPHDRPRLAAQPAPTMLSSMRTGTSWSAVTGGVQVLDRLAIRLVAGQPRNPNLDRVISALTDLGKGPAWAAFGLTGIALNRNGAPNALVGVLLAWVASFAVERWIKTRVHRERPRYPGRSDRSQEDPTDRWSFPSGHALGAFGCAVAMAGVYPRATPVLLSAATAVAGARVYLRLHFPSDCLAGAAMGTGLGLLIGHLVRPSRRSRATKVDPAQAALS